MINPMFLATIKSTYRNTNGKITLIAISKHIMNL